jgi:tetratricopeptide (TPR) repeat protein
LRAASILFSNGVNRSGSSNAIRLAERALDLDPQNVLAQIELAAALASRVENGWSRDHEADLARAEGLVDAALARQPQYSWAHFTKGWLLALKGQWTSALTENEMAIEDDQSNAKAYAKAGNYKIHLGRSAESVADVETALRLSPHDNDARVWQADLCYGLANSAQWERAIVECEKAVAAIPDDWPDHKYALGHLAAAYAWAGRDKEAKETLARLRKLDVNYLGAFQSALDASDNQEFRTALGRIMESLRKLDASEGQPKSN